MSVDKLFKTLKLNIAAEWLAVLPHILKVPELKITAFWDIVPCSLIEVN
jgi:hypothetical protein